MPLALLDCLDVTDDDHVLLVGDDTLDLMCALLRRGCSAVTEMRPQDGVRPERVELVVAPGVADIATARHVLALARRALAPHGVGRGRLVLRIPHSGDHTLSRAVAQALRAEGFDRPRRRPLADALVLIAELPGFWMPRTAGLAAGAGAQATTHATVRAG